MMPVQIVEVLGTRGLAIGMVDQIRSVHLIIPGSIMGRVKLLEA